MNIKYLILITLTVIAFFVISGLSIYSVARAEGTLFLPCKSNYFLVRTLIGEKSIDDALSLPSFVDLT